MSTCYIAMQRPHADWYVAEKALPDGAYVTIAHSLTEKEAMCIATLLNKLQADPDTKEIVITL